MHIYKYTIQNMTTYRYESHTQNKQISHNYAIARGKHCTRYTLFDL